MLIDDRIKSMQDLMESLADQLGLLEDTTNNANQSLIEVCELKQLCDKYPDLVTLNGGDDDGLIETWHSIYKDVASGGLLVSGGWDTKQLAIDNFAISDGLTRLDVVKIKGVI